MPYVVFIDKNDGVEYDSRHMVIKVLDESGEYIKDDDVRILYNAYGGGDGYSFRMIKPDSLDERVDVDEEWESTLPVSDAFAKTKPIMNHSIFGEMITDDEIIEREHFKTYKPGLRPDFTNPLYYKVWSTITYHTQSQTNVIYNIHPIFHNKVPVPTKQALMRLCVDDENVSFDNFYKEATNKRYIANHRVGKQSYFFVNPLIIHHGRTFPRILKTLFDI